ncbi:MAG: DNA mismatch repair protein MutS [Dehalococcoidia bacterium]|nr:DNA mismatch repair protein MutS [Dehalococcoidia bacterium]
MSDITPIRRQYLRIKQHYTDAIVLFRLGDFYETFDDDAVLASHLLGITLTAREMGKGNRIPMAGIPYHALDNYLGRLISAGHKVAICEQLTEPSNAKGLVDRDVVRVITPGMLLEPVLLESGKSNYLASLYIEGARAGLAYTDISTGEFEATEGSFDRVLLALQQIQPSETLVPSGAPPFEALSGKLVSVDVGWFDLDFCSEILTKHFRVMTLESFGLDRSPLAIRAAGAVISYVSASRKSALAQLTSLSTRRLEEYMPLDIQTIRNLEIFQSGRTGSQENSLLSVIDLTKTPMGGRLLRRWLSQPLVSVSGVMDRLDSVESLYSSELLRRSVISALTRINDLERLVNRVRGRIATPRDVVALRRSLESVADIQETLSGIAPKNVWLLSGLRPFGDIVTLIASSIMDMPPVEIGDEQVIKDGFNQELDSFRSKSRDVKSFIAALEQSERDKTGIKTLKIGYNNVFGYYIEVSKSHVSQAPPEYIRKQTVAGGERFITPELKEYESQILHAQEGCLKIESELFTQICDQISASYEPLLDTAHAVAKIDVISSLAEAAVRQNYIRPSINDGPILRIVGGRHPIVERVVERSSFVQNDTLLDKDNSQLIILTGPNMSGKSTYLRQVALIVLMAQIGSFVPASEAEVGMVDRIFTRIGLQDDLAIGRSTFMVEMVETAAILSSATPHSLIILDEIGRGTSTYDGLSIARSVAEYIHNSPRLGSRTLFATHYHELTDLEGTLPHARNFRVAVAEEGGDIIFLHRIIPGGADKSYGVHVARLAGLPEAVLLRAQKILGAMEKRSPENKGETRSASSVDSSASQDTLFQYKMTRALLDELASIDIDSLTPLEALTRLNELKSRLKSI